MLSNVLEEYIDRMTKNEPELLQELSRKTCEEFQDAGMMSSRVSGRFLKILVQLMNARKILEIGMFSGYASLSMAESLPDDGQLFCCEIDTKAIDFAKRFFKQSPYHHKIKILEGSADHSIKQTDGDFDLVFIDADKEKYSTYYELALEKLRRGGAIVVDNALWSGNVLDPKTSADYAIASLNEKIVRDERVENVLLSVRDGMNLIIKK
ncbi:MAG: O-methyltransferase [Oligoflexales bacterium]